MFAASSYVLNAVFAVLQRVGQSGEEAQNQKDQVTQV